MTGRPLDGPLVWNVAGLLADEPGATRAYDVADARPELPDGLAEHIGGGQGVGACKCPVGEQHSAIGSAVQAFTDDFGGPARTHSQQGNC